MADVEEKKTTPVPFGKYKGQPIETLLSDQPYLDWLTSQDWFRQKYQNIYAVIINYPGKPVETPDHNRMQVKFLSRDYRLKLAFLLVGTRLFRWNQEHFDQFVRKFLEDAKDKLGYTYNGKFHDDRSKYLQEPISRLDGSELLSISEPIFEDKGVDVTYEVNYGYGWDFGVSEEAWRQAPELFERFRNCATHLNLRIELKPSVGDDFPAVLRQMKLDHSNILVLQTYSGTGASWKQFLEYFKSQKIRVALESDIDHVVLPRYDEKLKVNVDELASD